MSKFSVNTIFFRREVSVTKNNIYSKIRVKNDVPVPCRQRFGLASCHGPLRAAYCPEGPISF